MDMDLLSAWITSNRRLLAAGRPTDRLFDRFIRFIRPNKEDETIVALHGFYTAFMESRAYSVGSAIYRQHLDATKFAFIDNQFRAFGVGAVEDDGGAALLEEEEIDESNFYQLGQRWGEIMTDTIRRARELR